MKKLVLLTVILAVFSGSLVLAESTSNEATSSALPWKMSAGLDMPTVGWVIRNEEGQITGVHGINLGLGYSAKYYFEPIKLNKFNPYWGWGTFLLIIPYVVVGGDYVTDSGFYVGAYGGVNLLTVLTLVPMIGIELGIFF